MDVVLVDSCLVSAAAAVSRPCWQARVYSTITQWFTKLVLFAYARGLALLPSACAVQVGIKVMNSFYAAELALGAHACVLPALLGAFCHRLSCSLSCLQSLCTQVLSFFTALRRSGGPDGMVSGHQGDWRITRFTRLHSGACCGAWGRS